MPTFTTRMGLVKPAGTEQLSRSQWNGNLDVIDKWNGVILVNDGVVPATVDLFDGAIVKEKTSDITWVAEKNGGGTYDQNYINYPWHLQSDITGPVYPSGSAMIELGVGNFNVGTNSTAAAIGGSPGRCTVPVKGIYSMNANLTWSGASSAGLRAASFSLAGVLQPKSERIENPVAGFPFRQTIRWQRELSAGTTVGVWAWQTSGGALGCDLGEFSISLIAPKN